MLYSFRSLDQTAGAALALLLTLFGFGTVSAECIDYADYAHWVGGVDTPGDASGVSISGSHAYIGDRTLGLQVIDITDPTRPQIVGSVGMIDWAIAVSPSDSLVYIVDGSAGLVILPAQCDSPSSVDPVDPGQPGFPSRFELLGASPNPFTVSTSIAFDLPVATAVTLRVYDVQGRLVQDLVSETLPAGRATATWAGRAADGRPVMSGTYFYRLQAGELQETRKLVYIRQSVSSTIR